MLGMQEQQFIQDVIDSAHPDEYNDLREQAKSSLEFLCMKPEFVNYRKFSAIDNKEFEMNVEMLTRLETNEKGKGYFYRTKRRMQIAYNYMKV